MEIKAKFSVCVDCFQVIVNGDTTSLSLLGKKEAEEIERKIEGGIKALLSGTNGYLTAGNLENEEEFSTTRCECCDASKGGSRFEVILISTVEEKEKEPEEKNPFEEEKEAAIEAAKGILGERVEVTLKPETLREVQEGIYRNGFEIGPADVYLISIFYPGENPTVSDLVKYGTFSTSISVAEELSDSDFYR